MPNNAPHNALRYHVSGAIARGEAVPIVNVDPVKRGPSPLSSVPRRPLTPRVVAALALASRWNTLRPGSVLIPETPATARAAYVRSRERGETVERALHRARAELAAHAVLGYAYTDTTSDAIDAYDVDPRELARVTSDPRYADVNGVTFTGDAETGALILTPVTLPDGATARVYVYDDPDADVSGEAYDDGPREAFGESWSFVGVSAVVTLADGARGEASLWGVARGHYWHGTGEAQIWHAVPDLIREAAGEAADADPDADNIPARDRATCGECGRSWNARTLPTPAGRCPFEHEHDEHDEHDDDDDDEPYVDDVAALAAENDENARKVDAVHALAITALRHGTDVSPAAIIAATERENDHDDDETPACDACGREDRPLTRRERAGVSVHLCDRHAGEPRERGETPAESLAAEVRSEVNAELVRFVENAEDGATATDAAADVVQRLAYLYGVYAEAAR